MPATLIPKRRTNVLNETHDPSLTSWLESANDSAIGFPVQHLPFAMSDPNPDQALSFNELSAGATRSVKLLWGQERTF